MVPEQRPHNDPERGKDIMKHLADGKSLNTFAKTIHDKLGTDFSKVI